MLTGVLHTKNQNALSEAVFNYYNNKKDDRNLLQSQLDGLVHHHFGIKGLDLPMTATQEEILAEVQRQETAQTDYLISLLGVSGGATVYDVGCGRGGTMFRLLDTHPQANAWGINLTEYQTMFCQEQIAERGLQGRAGVTQGDFLHTPFTDDIFSHAIVNEVTPYAASLPQFFAELHRVLQPGGRVALATWCFNDEKDTSEYWRFLAPICGHYASSMHGVNEYREAAYKYFQVVDEIDATIDTIKYWDLRTRWHLQSGVEPFFLEAHRKDQMRYVFFVLEKQK